MSSIKSEATGHTPAFQHDLFGDVAELPEGFAYQAGLITPQEETELARHLERLPFQAFDFHGHLANRRVVGFGLRYDYDRREVVEAAPIPDFLLPVREQVAAFARRPIEAFPQVLINEYRPGAGIGRVSGASASGPPGALMPIAVMVVGREPVMGSTPWSCTWGRAS